jgi:hypothetical protein
MVPLLKDHLYGPVKGGLSKEVIFDEGNLLRKKSEDTNLQISFSSSRASLTKQVVFHKVGLLKEASSLLEMTEVVLIPYYNLPLMMRKTG